MTLQRLFIMGGHWYAKLSNGADSITAPTAFFSTMSREHVLAELRRIGRVTIAEDFK